MRALAWLALAGMALGGCAGVRRVSPPRLSDDACGIGPVELWGTAELPSNAHFRGVMVGGLSGIDYRTRQRDYLLVSDDRGANGGGRAYRAVIAFGPDRSVEIRLIDSVALRQADGRPFDTTGTDGPKTDAESIRQGRAGWIYWTNEAGSARSPGPGLYRMRWHGGRSEALALPPRLISDPVRGTGPRDNRSLEGLSIDRDGTIWLGLEAPLLQDGPLPTPSTGSWARIINLRDKRSAGRDYLYPLEPIAHQLPGRLADNGLSEIIALPGPAFLVLERSGSQQPDGGFRFTSRLFCAFPKTGEETSRLSKRLIADLTTLGPFDTANFEGMTLGPRLPDGRRSLILIADNDFRAERPSIFAVLALR